LVAFTVEFSLVELLVAEADETVATWDALLARILPS